MMSREVKKTNDVEWFNNPNLITTFIIGLIALIVLLSQSFAIKNNLSPVTMLGSILNHNIMYLLVCIYFIALKTKTGKKYFDFLNIFLIVLYLLAAVTSLLTVFQSFGLSSLLQFMIDILILIYLFHTLLRNTRLWVNAELGKSPFNEISNNSYFSTILILAITLLAVDLISSTSFDGTVLSLLDTFYVGLFVRYVYLYGMYLDKKKIAINNDGSFDEIKEKIGKTVDDFVQDHNLDEKYDSIKNKVSDISEDVSEKVNDIKEDIQDIIKDNKLDEKLDKAKDVVSNFVEDVVDEANELTEKAVKMYKDSELDEKLSELPEKSKEVVAKIVENDKKTDKSDKVLKKEIKSRKKPIKKKDNKTTKKVSK